ncbi:MAG: hypothetical protein AAGL68_02665 [Pseudomonadota bacterium]
MMSGSFLFGILLVAGFSLGLALIFDTQAPEMRWQRRALYAALGGAFVPLLLPVIVILVAEGLSKETALVVAVLMVMGFILAGIVGFPLTYWFCKRREAARGSLDPAQDFE